MTTHFRCLWETGFRPHSETQKNSNSSRWNFGEKKGRPTGFSQQTNFRCVDNFTQSTKLRHWQCCTFQELLALLILVGSFWHLLNGMICLGIWLQKISLVVAWPSTPALPFHLGNVRRSTVRTHNLKTWTESRKVPSTAYFVLLVGFQFDGMPNLQR